MLDDVDKAEAEVANVDIERILYRVNVLVDMLVLAIEFRQLLDVVELELLANGRSLHVLVGEAPRRCCDNDRRSGCPLARHRNENRRCNGGTGGGCN